MSRGFGETTDDNDLKTIAAEICNIMEARTIQQYPMVNPRKGTTKWNENTTNHGKQSNRLHIQPTRPISIPGGDNPLPPPATQPPPHASAGTNRLQPST